MSPNPVPGSATPAALVAFMRGLERRAAVLAELQAGDAARGDSAVERALRAFRLVADRHALGEWPHLFWSALLAQPALRDRVEVSIPLDPSDRMAVLAPARRAAVLLRLAAGLEEADAAAVLGLTGEAYRRGLAEAVAEVDPDSPEQAWGLLRDEVQRRVRTLSPERVARLGRSREQAIAQSVPAGTKPVGAAPPRGRRRRGLLAVLWILLVLCVLAFAATFWWPFPGPGLGWRPSVDAEAPGDGRVERAVLAEDAAPASRYDAMTAVLIHPDFEQVADPESARVAADAGFYSWLAATGGGEDAAVGNAADAGDLETEGDSDAP